MAIDTLVLPTITTSGTSWAEFKAGGLRAILDNLVAVAANAAKANPTTAATAAITAATGGLAAGTYRAAYTFVDAYGETTIGTSESNTFTVTGTAQLATLTLPANPTGVQAKYVYVTPVGGASGTEILYGTGITGTTFALDTAPKADVGTAGVPATNTTGAASVYHQLSTLLGLSSGLDLAAIANAVNSLMQGAPSSRRDQFVPLLRSYGIAATWAQIMKEAATLYWANQPTALTNTQDPIHVRQKWTMA